MRPFLHVVHRREIYLARQPGHQIKADDFAIRETALPPPEDGQVAVRNTAFTLDPYMRLPLTSQGGIRPGKVPGDAMEGGAIGVVVESRDPTFAVGAKVMSQHGWRTGFVAPAAELMPLADTAGVPDSWYLGVLGMTGVTAFAGIERVLQPQAGETILISGGAGAVGSIACALAKLRGARVLASAGTDDKITWLKDRIGVDAATNYRTESLADFLARECPAGIDGYFDNVGGDTLDTVLQTMKPGGRIALCGAISQYETGNYRAGPNNFFAIIERRLTLQGFNFGGYLAEAASIATWLAQRALDGQIPVEETIVDGLDAAPAAFVSLFDGRTRGKLLVRL